MNELFRPDADIVFFLLLFADSQEFWLKFADFWAPTRKIRSGLAHLYAFCKGGDGEVAAQLFCAPRVACFVHSDPRRIAEEDRVN